MPNKYGKCCVTTCCSNDKIFREQHTISFHSFPLSPMKRKIWVENLGLKEYTPVRSSLVCSQHFDKCDVIKYSSRTRIRRNAVPISYQAPSEMDQCQALKWSPDPILLIDNSKDKNPILDSMEKLPDNNVDLTFNVHHYNSEQISIGTILVNDGQSRILNYFKKKNSVQQQKYSIKPVDVSREAYIFGWTTFGEYHIPYILRQSKEFTALRMIERMEIHLKNLYPKVRKYVKIMKKYNMTESECRLLNEINRQHCDFSFGSKYFTLKDKLVLLSEVTVYYKLLQTFA